MKIKRVVVALVLAGALFAISTSFARAEDTYLGVQYVKGTFERENRYGTQDFEGDPALLLLRIGHYLTRFFSIELRGGAGITEAEDTIDITGVNIRFQEKIDYLLGGYGVVHLNITDTFSIYGLAGYTRMEGATSVTGTALENSGEKSDFSYGGGIALKFNDRFGANIEYVSYIEDSFDFSAIAGGLTIHF